MRRISSSNVGIRGPVLLTSAKTTTFRPIYWLDRRVRLIDQTRLPMEEVWLELPDYRDIVRAITEMRIRGAPAIGVAGAYAVALAAQKLAVEPDFTPRLEEAAQEIREATSPPSSPRGGVVREPYEAGPRRIMEAPGG